jgi:hypothetical protein
MTRPLPALFRPTFLLVLLGTAAGCAQQGQDSASPGPTVPSVVSATSTIQKTTSSSLASATGIFRDLVSDRVQSDGLGPYINGTTGVTSAINSGGNYELNTGLPHGTRKLKFLAPTSYGPGCSLPFQEELTGADMANQHISKLTSMAVNTSIPVTMIIVLTPAETPSTEYNLTYDPTIYPEASYITATRTSPSTWTLEAASTAVAKIETNSTRGAYKRVPCGDAIGMPFLITVTLQ